MKIGARINSFPVIRIIRSIGAAAICWMVLAAGFVTINMDTFKFVPAAVLFSAAFGVMAFSVVPAGSKLAQGLLSGRHSRRHLLLLGIHFFFTVFPSIIWRYGYDEPYLIGLSAVCFAVSLIAVYSLNSAEALRGLIFLFTGLLGILSVFGVLEYFGLALVSLNRQTFAVAVSCNNPNLYSGVLLVLLPASYLSAFLVRNTMVRRDRALQILSIVISVLGLVNLAMTQSRSALIGHFLSLVLIVVFLPRAVKTQGRTRSILRIGAMGCFSLAILALILFNDQFRNKIFSTFVEENSRLLAWRTALRIWFRSPLTLLFGNGIGSFNPLFFTFKPAGYRLGPHMSSWDAAHNEYLELLVDGGILSLAAFLVLVGSVLWTGIRALPRGGAGKSEIDESGLLILYPLTVIPALLADGFFSTNLRTSYIRVLFFMVLALVPVVTDGSAGGLRPADLPLDHPDEGQRPVSDIYSGRLAFALLCAVFVLLVPMDFIFVRRFVSERLALRASLCEDLAEKESLFERAVTAEPGNVIPAAMLAEFCLSVGQYSSFNEQAERIDGMIPNFAGIGYLRGMAAIRSGDLETAFRLLEEYLVIDRGDQDAEEALLYTYAAMGNTDTAVLQWARVLEFLQQNRDRFTAAIRIEPGGTGIRIDPGSAASGLEDGKYLGVPTVVMGAGQAAAILSAAVGAPAVPIETFLFRVHFLTADIFRQASMPEAAAFFFIRAARAAGRGYIPASAPPSFGAGDAALFAEAVNRAAAYHAERANAAAAAGDEVGRIAHLSTLLSLSGDPALREMLAGLYRRRGSFKRAAIVQRF